MSKALKIVGTIAAIYFTAGVALAVGVTAVAGASIVTIANALALGALVSGISRALTPKPRLAGNPGVQTEYAGTVEPGRIIAGRVRVSGMNTIPPLTTGQDNQNLHQVLAVAYHEIDGYDSFWANQEQISVGTVTGGANDGLVTAGTYANNLWLRPYTGTSTQTADFILTSEASASWTANHRGRGVAYLAAKFKADETKYRSGKPEISAIARGLRCYDPRLDTSPGANPANPAYIVFTTCPPLIAARYLMDTRFGRKVPASRIDWALVVAAANICDEFLTAGSAPPSGMQRRYTCNAVFSCADDPYEVLATIASSMMGVIYRSGSKWRMYAGAWATPSFSLAVGDLVGSVDIETEIPKESKWNSVRGSFLNAAANYQQAEFQPRVSSAFVATDGGQKWKEVQFAACTDEYESQRNAIVLLRQSRNRKTVVAEFGLSAFPVRIFETGTVTIPEIGWTNQTVRCLGWKFNPTGTVTLTLKEEYSTDWANPATADYTVPGEPIVPTIGYTRPGTPTAFTVTPAAGGVRIQITAGDPVIEGQGYRLYRGAVGTPFSSATLIGQVSSTDVYLQTADLTQYDWWVVAYANGTASAPRPTGAGVTAGARRVETGDITPDAATEVLTAYSATPLILSATAYAFHSLSFTPTQAGRINATISGSPYFASGNQLKIWLRIDQNGSTLATSEGTSANLPTNNQPVMRQISASVVANQSVSVVGVGAGPQGDPWGDPYLKDSYILVEFIKR